MVETNKKYWLYILPYVYCCIKDTKALLYNTQTGGNMEICIPEILELLRSLHEKQNLGCIRYDGKILEHEPYRSFLIEFCRKGMGNLSDVEETPEKPIQLMPVLNLQRDVEKMQKEQDRSIGEDILRYLLEVNIYLNNDCRQDCRFCSDYFRQSLCCTKIDAGQRAEMKLSLLQNLLSQIRFGHVGKLNFLGGNILKYLHYEKLTYLLEDFKERVHIWNHYANYINTNTLIHDFLYDIPVTFPVDEKAWNNCLVLFKDKQAKYHFFITGIEDYEKTEELINNCKLINYSVHPVYTQKNQDFFEEYVYTNQEEIFQTIRSFRQIFSRQKLNTWFFGSLTIFPDGSIYANVNSSSLGNIESDRLLDIIDKEMIENTAWRKIRDMAPCDSCLYQFLCLSPSNYELVMKKPDLCHLNK